MEDNSIHYLVLRGGSYQIKCYPQLKGNKRVRAVTQTMNSSILAQVTCPECLKAVGPKKEV